MQQVHHEAKTERNHGTVSPVAAGLTGLLIGAAGAAAIALSDEETRKKAIKKAKHLKDDLQKWSNKTISDMQNKGEQMKIDAKSDLESSKSAVSKEVKERLDDTESIK